MRQRCPGRVFNLIVSCPFPPVSRWRADILPNRDIQMTQVTPRCCDSPWACSGSWDLELPDGVGVAAQAAARATDALEQNGPHRPGFFLPAAWTAKALRPVLPEKTVPARRHTKSGGHLSQLDTPIADYGGVLPSMAIAACIDRKCDGGKCRSAGDLLPVERAMQ